MLNLSRRMYVQLVMGYKEISRLSSSGCPAALSRFRQNASLKYPRRFALVRMLGTHLKNTYGFGGDGGWSVGRRWLIDLATYGITSVLDQCNPRSDRTSLTSHQHYCDLPTYRTLQVQSQPWGAWALTEFTDSKQVMEKEGDAEFLTCHFSII